MSRELGVYDLALPGAMTKRGFWLYVWVIEAPDGRTVHYVGRTGDNSSPYASSVYRRMGQHLGDADKTNALLQHLRRLYPDAEIESFPRFRMVSCGPVFPEVDRHLDFEHGMAPHYAEAFERHKPFRDRAAALEAKLARVLADSGYVVVNEVRSYASLVDDDWIAVRDALAAHFPMIRGQP